jgi:thiamine pyrophosphokinase
MKAAESETTVILADGSYPVHDIPLGYLKNADHIICCDGSARVLVDNGFMPEAIVGDLDSLDEDLAVKYSDRLYKETEQENNDLTKAVRWCVVKGYNDIVILGATGKREDHTLGNISLLAEYVRLVRVKMVTDTGIFIPCLGSCRFSTSPGQQVSVFSIDPETEITSEGLRYPLVRRKLKNWWEATLNEATGDSFSLEFKKGRVIVFLKYF